MHFTAAVVVALFGAATASAALVQRQTASFPTCATSCVLDPPNLFGCSATDNQCLCTNQQYVGATTQCIESACSASDAASAEAASRQLCAAVGVTITSSASSTPTASATDSSATDTSAASGTNSSSASAASSTAPTSSSDTSNTSAAPSPTQSQSSAVSHGANVFIGAAALVLAVANL